jgi:hypothetical protein
MLTFIPSSFPLVALLVALSASLPLGQVKGWVKVGLRLGYPMAGPGICCLLLYLGVCMLHEFL